ncbi:proline dehydrogenase family protein [bacterium]|nr:proline dehydrogenase family protein [candidate division CSSED10-310 bacterium]
MSFKESFINLAPDFVTKLFAAPYIAGDSEEAGVAAARALWNTRRIHSTIDLLGEEVTVDSEVQTTIDSYHTLIDLLGEQEFATISLKPTQLGSHKSTAYCQDVIARICEDAGNSKIPVTIDMEDSSYTDMTLEIYKNLLPSFPTLGTVLQTRLFRTGQDIKNLRGLKARVRLCIGIYLEPPAIALQRKPDMKRMLLEQAEVMLDDGHYVELGTHDEHLIEQLLNMIERRGFTNDQYEIQMLMGVPRIPLQDALVKQGITVRYYVPYAVIWKHAFAYSKRRLAANPRMGLYIARNLVRSIFRRNR